MNSLYLDIGNSFLKLAQKKEDHWKILFQGEILKIDNLSAEIKSKKDVEKIIVSSVRKDLSKKLRAELEDWLIHEYNTSDIPSDMLDYKTPKTLGLDRFLACLAAWKESGENNVIVIDAGSACTIDLMTSGGVFNGGVIMPGLQLIRNSMKNRLPELPEVPAKIPQKWPGKSTIECVGWGVNGGFVMAILGFVNQYRAIVKNPDVYITGGDAKQLIEWVDEELFLNHNKNLIWDGLEEFEKLIQK